MKSKKEIIVKCTHYGDVVIPENLSLPEFIMSEMEKYRHKVAVIEALSEKAHTFAQLLQDIREMTAGLQHEGLQQSDVIAISSTNCVEYFTVAMAALRLGAAITTANPAYTTEELVKQFNGAHAKFVFIQPEQLKLMKEVQLHVPSLEVSKNEATKIFLLASSKKDHHHTHLETFSDLLYRGRTKATVKLANIKPRQDLALLLYSSGTTGLPKGVMLTHYNIVANLCQSTKVGQRHGSRGNMMLLDATDIYYAAFPYFHVGGMMFSLFWPLVQGATVIIAPRFVLGTFLNAVSKYKVTVVHVPPPVLVLLSKSPQVKEYNLNSLRTIISGASPVPPEEARRVMNSLQRHPVVIQAYGMTELSPLCHMMVGTEESRSRLNSIGVLIPATESKRIAKTLTQKGKYPHVIQLFACLYKKIFDSDSENSVQPYVKAATTNCDVPKFMAARVVDPKTGNCCLSGEKGEIWIRGPQVMKGYLNNPQATKATITQDGFLRTGDIGYYDCDGYFYVVDRLKELIKVRGFQVAPAELEGLILTHPYVADVVVIGVPDSYSGELPRAYVIRKQGHSVSEEEIKNHIVGHVARYKELAGGVRFVTELPKTASGKPLRRVLLEEARKEINKTKNSKL